MLNSFVNLCEKGYEQKDIKNSIHAHCVHPHMYGIH